MSRMTRRQQVAINGVIKGARTWTVVAGDCLSVLQGLPADSVDAIITDPPFFCITHYQSTAKKQRSWADMSLLAHGWGAICNEAKRAMKCSGQFAVFCNAVSYPMFFGPMYDRWGTIKCLVWDKMAPGLGHIWRHQHELILLARDPGAWEPKDGRLRIDVLKHRITPAKRRIHPVQKPVDLLAELVTAMCPPDGVVMDPFLGSGTAGRACVLNDRRFIGAELNPAYAAAARRLIRSRRTVESASAADSRRATPRTDPRRKPSKPRGRKLKRVST